MLCFWSYVMCLVGFLSGGGCWWALSLSLPHPSPEHWTLTRYQGYRLPSSLQQMIPAPRNIDIAATVLRFFEQHRECTRLDGRPIPLNAEEEREDTMQRENHLLIKGHTSTDSTTGSPVSQKSARRRTLGHVETVVGEVDNLRMHVNCLRDLLNIPRCGCICQVFISLFCPAVPAARGSTQAAAEGGAQLMACSLGSHRGSAGFTAFF